MKRMNNFEMKKGVNWNNEPKHIGYEKDFGYFGYGTKDYSWTEACPSCHNYLQEVLKDKEGNHRCIFCGQKLLPPEKHWVADSERVGYEQKEDGKFYCSECGGEVTGKKHECHIDGTDFYSWSGSLIPCGHPWEVMIMRYKGKWVDVDQDNFDWDDFTRFTVSESTVRKEEQP